MDIQRIEGFTKMICTTCGKNKPTTEFDMDELECLECLRGT